ncbi:MAG: hypothetical protein DRN04_02115 [Thermoprotei archaeon]|nr:MAG: hypothetical protein DRN04_02115 [Thermoprotei archaeon]
MVVGGVGVSEGPSRLFIVAYMYAVNKVAYKVLDKGGIVLSRAASDELIGYLVRRGVLSKESSVDEVKSLFVEKLKVAGDMCICEKGDTVVVELKNMKIAEFLELTKMEKFEPVACPLIEVIIKVCEKSIGGKLVIKKIDVPDSTRVNIVRKKIV